jgi:hypothetical protein
LCDKKHAAKVPPPSSSFPPTCPPLHFLMCHRCMHMVSVMHSPTKPSSL